MMDTKLIVCASLEEFLRAFHQTWDSNWKKLHINSFQKLLREEVKELILIKLITQLHTLLSICLKQ